MSDGMTDAFRMTLAHERRIALVRSILALLKDQWDKEKQATAVNDVMAYQNWLFVVEGGSSREDGAALFLDFLVRKNRKAWSRLFALILGQCGDWVDGQEFQELKGFSPFSGKALILMQSNGTGMHIHAARDLQNSLARQLSERSRSHEQHHLLLALDVTVSDDFEVKP